MAAFSETVIDGIYSEEKITRFLKRKETVSESSNGRPLVESIKRDFLLIITGGFAVMALVMNYDNQFYNFANSLMHK